MTIRMRRAQRHDVAAIVALLADDARSGEAEEVSYPPAAAYLDAFARLDAEPRSLLAVAEAADGTVVGTLQVTFIPGLSNRGGELALLSAVRIAGSQRGRGLGGQMVGWAIDEARRRGCGIIELLSHASRTDAQRFYERLGFVRSHVGMRMRL
jgi:GNAT superfamily N-acetyltransferase